MMSTGTHNKSKQAHDEFCIPNLWSSSALKLATVHESCFVVLKYHASRGGANLCCGIHRKSRVSPRSTAQIEHRMHGDVTLRYLLDCRIPAKHLYRYHIGVACCQLSLLITAKESAGVLTIQVLTTCSTEQFKRGLAAEGFSPQFSRPEQAHSSV